MGDRVHWYMVFALLGLLVFYFLCLQAEINANYLQYVADSISYLVLVSLFFGFWLVIFSISVYIRDRIFPVSVFMLSLLRLLMVAGMDFLFSLASKFVLKGFIFQ